MSGAVAIGNLPGDGLVAAEAQASKCRVLVVEHDADARALLEEQLGRSGFEVAATGDGLTALSLYERRRPDLVVTELNPPKMSDWELLRWLRRQDPELPVICTSAADDWRTAV